MKGASFGQKPFETLKYRVTGKLDTLSRNIATSAPSSCHQCHFRLWKVTRSFSTITFHRDQLEGWKHHRCFQAHKTDRLICNINFPDQDLDFDITDVDLRSNFQHCLLRSNYVVHSMRLDKRNTMLAKEMLCLYWVKSDYRKTFIPKNGLFFSFSSLEAKPFILDQIWGHIRERTLKELSNELLRSAAL